MSLSFSSFLCKLCLRTASSGERPKHDCLFICLIGRWCWWWCRALFRIRRNSNLIRGSRLISFRTIVKQIDLSELVYLCGIGGWCAGELGGVKNNRIIMMIMRIE